MQKDRQTGRQGTRKGERVADLQCSSTRAFVFISYFIGLVLSLIESSTARFWYVGDRLLLYGIFVFSNLCLVFWSFSPLNPLICSLSLIIYMISCINLHGFFSICVILKSLFFFLGFYFILFIESFVFSIFLSQECKFVDFFEFDFVGISAFD